MYISQSQDLRDTDVETFFYSERNCDDEPRSLRRLDVIEEKSCKRNVVSDFTAMEPFLLFRETCRVDDATLNVSRRKNNNT